jgi:integrase
MLAPVFRRAKIAGAHAHRFRHTLATDILARGGTMAHVADVLGISEHIARRHYAKWSAARQERIPTIVRLVHGGEADATAMPTVHDRNSVVIR